MRYGAAWRECCGVHIFLLISRLAFFPCLQDACTCLPVDEITIATSPVLGDEEEVRRHGRRRRCKKFLIFFLKENDVQRARTNDKHEDLTKKERTNQSVVDDVARQTRSMKNVNASRQAGIEPSSQHIVQHVCIMPVNSVQVEADRTELSESHSTSTIILIAR